MGMTYRSVWSMAAATAAVAVGLVAASVHASAPALPAVSAAPVTVIDRLARQHIVLRDAPGAPTVVAESTAVRLGRRWTPTGRLASIHTGFVTDLDRHVGDETSPLVVRDRLVYAVRFTNVRFRLRGGAHQVVEADNIVFVDATTGEGLFALTI